VARMDPELEAWLFDFSKKTDEAADQLKAVFRYLRDSPAPLDVLDHHLRVAQGKLAIARVDLAAARTASLRRVPSSPPGGDDDSSDLDDDDQRALPDWQGES